MCVVLFPSTSSYQKQADILRGLNSTKWANSHSFRRESCVILFTFFFQAVLSSATSKWGSGRWEIFLLFSFNVTSFLFNLDHDKWKWIAARLYLSFAANLKCRTRQSENAAHRSFTSTCWQRLWISITLRRQGPFVFQIFKWYALFRDEEMMGSAGAANSAPSRPRPRRFQNCLHCLPHSLPHRSWAELSS